MSDPRPLVVLYKELHLYREGGFELQLGVSDVSKKHKSDNSHHLKGLPLNSLLCRVSPGSAIGHACDGRLEEAFSLGCTGCTGF